MNDFKGMTKSTLTIPPDFVPYVEKHRLYEFFYELVMQLMIQQPDNPVVFMKQCVQHAMRKQDIPRVILIAPPNFDKMSFAKILQKEIGIRPVTLEDFHALSPVENTCRCYDADEIAIRMKKMLMSGMFHKSGWILIDIPKNKNNARALQRVGIIPTHVIQIILPSTEEEAQNTQKDARQRDYKKICRGLREAYDNLLIEIEAGARTIQELSKDCAAIIKIRKHYGAPSLFRIVLIGFRGSGCHSLAKYISERFDLIHVDFNYILEQACSQEPALGEFLRLCKHRCGQKLKSKAKIQIVERYILSSECLKKGWILTSYPKTVEEFKLLDMTSTPPNRIIILKMDIQTCREKFLNNNSQYNITGIQYNLTLSDSSATNLCSKLDVHLKDYKNNVEQELREYENNINAIRQYAGETASMINATGERKCVIERLETCLMQPTPSAKSRIPQPTTIIDPMDIEFDPDDEPDASIFDDIRAPEPKYCFI